MSHSQSKSHRKSKSQSKSKSKSKSNSKVCKDCLVVSCITRWSIVWCCAHGDLQRVSVLCEVRVLYFQDACMSPCTTALPVTMSLPQGYPSHCRCHLLPPSPLAPFFLALSLPFSLLRLCLLSHCACCSGWKRPKPGDLTPSARTPASIPNSKETQTNAHRGSRRDTKTISADL